MPYARHLSKNIFTTLPDLRESLREADLFKMVPEHPKGSHERA